MFQWIKYHFVNSVNYGLETINFLTQQGFTHFLNIYGGKIFQLDDVKLIERTETIDNYNYYHLSDLTLKKSDMCLGNILLHLHTGTMEKFVLEIPWKNFENSGISIRVERISLSGEIREPNIMMTPENSEIEETDENVYINGIVGEISAYLIAYFRNIKFTVSHTCIDVDNFEIWFENFYYDGVDFTIDNLKIQKEGLSIGDINFFKWNVENEFSLEQASVDSLLFQLASKFWRDYYPSSAEPQLERKYNIAIKKFQWDDYFLSDFVLEINTSLVFYQLHLVTPYFSLQMVDRSKICCSWDPQNHTGEFSNWNLSFPSFENISLAITDIVQKIQYLSSLLFSPDGERKSILQPVLKGDLQPVLKGDLTILCENHQFDISCERIEVAEDFRLSEMQFQYENLLLKIGEITYNNVTQCMEWHRVICHDHLFSLDSDRIIIKKSGNQLHFGFSKTKLQNIDPFVHTLNRFISFFPSPEKSIVILYVDNSQFTYLYSTYELECQIKNGKVYLTDYYVTDAQFSVLLDRQLILALSGKLLSSTKMNIHKLEFFLNQKILKIIIDVIVKNIKTEETENFYSEDILEQLEKVLTNNIHLGDTYVSPIIKKNPVEIKIIEDYSGEESQTVSQIEIENIHIYLIDSLTHGTSPSQAFLEIILVKTSYQKKLYTSGGEKQEFQIQKGAISYPHEKNNANKYLFKSNGKNFPFLHLTVYSVLQNIRVTIVLAPLIFYIKKDILERINYFFSNLEKNNRSNPLFFQRLHIYPISIRISYTPFLHQEWFSIQNFHLVLGEQILENHYGIQTILQIILKAWSKEIHLGQILSHVKIIEPCTTFLENFFYFFQEKFHIF